MEEFIGGLWHKAVMRIASQRHPEAAVRFVEISKVAAVFFRAMGGDAGLNLTIAPATRHGARRRLLERIAGSGDKIELAWRDRETLRLPESIDMFPQKSMNRDLYLWLIALSAVETDNSLPWIVRNQAATQEVLRRFPGLLARYQRLVSATLAIRPSPLPEDEALQESAIRQALQHPGSVAALPTARQPFQPVHMWPHPSPPVVTDAQPVAGDGSPEREQTDQPDMPESRRKFRAERTEMPDGKDGFLMMFRAESLFSWSEYIKINRPQDEDDDTDAALLAAEDMEKLTVARDDKAGSSRLRFDLDLPSAGEDDALLGEGVSLPEWDFRKQVMQADHCRLQEFMTRQHESGELPQHLRRTARRLRSQFQALVPVRTWLKGQHDGSDLDLDQWVRYEADRRLKDAVIDRGFYRAQINRQRDLACLLLADLSLSTDAYASDHARVIDVIRDSLYLFSEALSATGDRFALYGFSSLKRGHVRFHNLKGFDEPYDNRIRGRIAAIKPGYYTRMGAAIRHATGLMLKQQSQQRLLLLLTDGKPNDLDQYEGRYGIEDTRVALLEARKLGLRPFCVTIDREANDYLPHLFGVGGYAVIRRPEELPRELPLLYAQMTR